MSEPMSTVEIEDVLSSIRRLVSPEQRPAARVAPIPPAAPARPAPEQPRTGSKLLLTPALRVVSDGAEPPSTKLPRLHLGVESRKDEGFEAFSAMGSGGVSDFESETGDPYPDVTRMEWTEQGWVLAELPTPVDEPQDTWAQEEYLTEEEAPAALRVDDMAEAPVANANDDDRMEAQAIAELDIPPTAQPAAAPAEASVDASDPLEVVFDEAVLREMVRDILREELQGRMGERMTRNIRKLVHAEIARLVAAQEFE